jgi:predicted phosphodiesterase
MKLHILSDLHLEFSTFEPIATDADVVVLAGDIGKKVSGIIWAREAFPDKEIIYVPGNHEFYGADRAETLAHMRIAADQCRVHLLDNDAAVINGVRFLGSTLWTDFLLFGDSKKSTAMSDGQNCLNDFRLIQDEEVSTPGWVKTRRAGWEGTRPVRFSPARSIELHEQSLAWLKTKLDEPFDGKTVVVTHHLPSKLSVVDRFKDQLLSACFASELDYLFGKMDLWIHGHTHDNLNYEANGTRVICNPRGYVTYRGIENFDFDPALVLELK